MYANGIGVPNDDAKAVEWYQKSAAQGDAAAQFYLGLMYADGRGVPNDDAKAVEWWQKCAAQGVACAQSKLGWMYGEGRGVPKDEAKAYAWFNIAAVNNDSDAIKSREKLEKTMTLEQKDAAQKLSRELFGKIKKPQE